MVKAKNWPIQPVDWYDPEFLIVALQSKYDCTREQVIQYKNHLLKMMNSPQTYNHVFDAWTSKPHMKK
jgi:hypothetical protein